MATEVKNIIVALRARIGDFKKKMSSAGRSAGAFLKTVKGGMLKVLKFGAYAAGAAVGVGILLDKLTGGMDATGKFADRIGISTTALTAMRHAGELAGVGADALDKGLEGYVRRLGDAQKGTGPAAMALKKFGLNAADLIKMPLEQQIFKIADGMKKLETPAERAAAANALLGKSGMQMITLLSAGAPAMKKAMAKAEALGITYNRGQAAMAENVQDSLTRIKGIFRGFGRGILKSMLPTIQATGAWIIKNKDLVITIVKVVAGIAAAVVGIIVLTTVATAAGTVFSVLTAAVGFFRVALVFLMANPIIAVLVGIAAAAAAVAAAFGFMKEKTAEVSDEMQKALGVGDKLRATDKLRMERLKQLADLESRNSDEMKEARDLVGVLTERYGDLGIKIDTATGKIRGLTGAQGALNTRMKEAAILDAEAAYREIEQNIGNLRDKFNNPGWWSGRTDAAATAWQKGSEGQDMQKRIGTMELRQRAASKRYIALLRGDMSAVTGGVEGDKEKLKRKISEGKADTAAAIAARKKVTADAESAIKRLAALDEQAAAKNRTALEKELFGIQQIVDERKRLLRVLIEGERTKKGGGNEAKIFKLEMRYYDVVAAAEKEKTAAAAAAAKKAKTPDESGIAKRKSIVTKAASKTAPERSREFGILARGVNLRGLAGAFKKPDVAIADNTKRTADVLERMERRQGVFFN